MRNEQIRRELERKFTHVTFVKSKPSDIGRGWTIWLVNEEMEQIRVWDSWKIEEVLFHLAVRDLERIVKIRTKKYKVFVELMQTGKIETDHTIYKKKTLQELQELL